MDRYRDGKSSLPSSSSPPQSHSANNSDKVQQQPPVSYLVNSSNIDKSNLNNSNTKIPPSSGDVNYPQSSTSSSRTDMYHQEPPQAPPVSVGLPSIISDDGENQHNNSASCFDATPKPPTTTTSTTTSSSSSEQLKPSNYGDGKVSPSPTELNKQRRFKIDRVDSFKAGHSSSLTKTNSLYSPKLSSTSSATMFAPTTLTSATPPSCKSVSSCNNTTSKSPPSYCSPTISKNTCPLQSRKSDNNKYINDNTKDPILQNNKAVPFSTSIDYDKHSTLKSNPNCEKGSIRKGTEKLIQQPILPPSVTLEASSNPIAHNMISPLHSGPKPASMTALQSVPQSPGSPSPPIFQHRKDTSRSDSKGEFDNESTTESGITNGHTIVISKESYSTFGHNTVEALPRLDHFFLEPFPEGYRNQSRRPTLAELHDIMEENKDEEQKNKLAAPLLPEEERTANDVNVASSGTPQTATKFGWIKGVLVRCLLNIWGVMLFLRLSWVVGQSGIALATVVVLLSAVVTIITTLSMSAICTNGEVKGGGAYYLISRSLGPEFGGAIGIVFSIANAVAIAMYVVGFAETVRDLLKANNALLIDEVNDIRVIGVITITLLLGIAIIGMEWEARAQMILLGILLISMAVFFIGTFFPPTLDNFSKGYTGYSAETFRENFLPDFKGEEFFSVFAIFFPAATGILAGANISGDLKDAQSAIPKGTLLAILLSSAIYILSAWILGACVLREASGAILYTALNSSIDTVSQQTANLTAMDNGQKEAYVNMQSIRNCTLGEDGICKYGLHHDFQVMERIAAFGPLVTAGIFSATLSSALASLVSAPKVFQAVCKDKIFPGIHVLAKGHGKGDNPRRLYLLAYLIGVAFICIGELNAIAPIISNFFLMSYALINYSCFDASLANSPGWRPAFRWYSMWISLMGAILCIAVMFIIKWWTALLTFAVIASLYIYVHHRKPDVNWGSSTQAHVYKNALQSTLKLIAVEDHIKNFRPQVLLLSGLPSSRPALVDFVSSFTRNCSLMICCNIIVDPNTESLKVLRTSEEYNWLHRRKIKCFYNPIISPDFRLGVQSFMQTCGVGKLRPNTLVIGFKNRWRNANPEEAEDYFNVIHDAFDMQFGVGILRVKEGFQCDPNFVDPPRKNSHKVTVEEEQTKQRYDDDDDEVGPNTPERRPSIFDSSLGLNMEEVATPDVIHESIVKPDNFSEESLKMMNRFNEKQSKGTIDVWWLFDDGGLTLLIPYLISLENNWGKNKLRVFTAGTKKGELDREQRQLATLLSKFRIECKDMTVIPDVGKLPRSAKIKEFEELLEGWILDEEKGETKEKYPWKTSRDQLKLLKDKTNRHIRLRELMFQHSSDANLIVMTLPMPRKGTCSSGLYMAWIDTLTRDLPPILLLRGNQRSVLTFYS